MRVEQVQPQSIADDTEAAQAHRGGAEHRTQRPPEERDPHARGERDADDIVDERPEQVLVDIPEGRPRQADRGDSLTQAAAHQHHVGLLPP